MVIYLDIAPYVYIYRLKALSREGKKHCKTQYKINILHIHTIKLQLASGEPPASALYMYMQDIKQLILSILLLDYTINENFILKKLDDPSLLSIIWMVKIQYWFGFNPYENMSSSVGIMKFPIYMESHKIHVPNHQPDINWCILAPMFLLSANLFTRSGQTGYFCQLISPTINISPSEIAISAR